jgi:hypothetical protein
MAMSLWVSPVLAATGDEPLEKRGQSAPSPSSTPAPEDSSGVKDSGPEVKEMFRGAVLDATGAVADEAKSLTDSAVEFGKDTAEKYSEEHAYISNKVTQTAIWLDDLFKTSRNVEEENKSWLRISAEARVEKGRGTDMNISTDLRLVLPTLEKRTSLIISNLADEADTRLVETAPPTNSDITAGLRHIFSETDTFNFRADAAMRYVNLRPDPFGRLRLRMTSPGDEMETNVTTRLTWFTTTGFEAQAVADFDIKFFRRDLLRFSPEINWYEVKEKPGYYYGAPLRYFQPLGKKDAIMYETYVWLSSYPVHRIDDFGVRASYRRSVYKGWVYAEIGAWLRFPRERDFSQTPGALITVDTYFGHTE